MFPLTLKFGSEPPASILVVGAHPDDIEIGAGATLLTLSDSQPGLRAHYVVLTGSADRHMEARNAAQSFIRVPNLSIELHNLPEGRLPSVWNEVKEILEAVRQNFSPDLIIGPNWMDAHQDHRVIGEIIPTAFRDCLYWAYEIPKWDGDLGNPSLYVPMSAEIADRKVELLNKCFPSQRFRSWWDDEVFFGLARLRGIECGAHYAEGFSCRKMVVKPS